MLSSAPARALYLFNTGYLPLNYSGNSGVNGESYRGLGTLHLVVHLETAVWQQAKRVPVAATTERLVQRSTVTPWPNHFLSRTPFG